MKNTVRVLYFSASAERLVRVVMIFSPWDEVGAG
jgi:hypothetical protein